MIQHNTISYLNELITGISKQVHIVMISQNPEAVHDTRVGIKRIRALLKVFNLERENRKIKKILRREVRKIYITAGNLREFDVQLELVKEYENILQREFYNLKEYLGKKINKRKKTLRKAFPEKNIVLLASLKTEVAETVNSIPDEAITRRIEKYLEIAFKKFNKYKEHINAKDLHQQRKLLKEIRFCHEMMDGIYPEYNAAEQITAIKEVEDILGRWHDYDELKRTVVKFLRRLKKSKVDKVIKMNMLSEIVSNDIVLLLDNYNKIIHSLDLH